MTWLRIFTKSVSSFSEVEGILQPFSENTLELFNIIFIQKNLSWFVPIKFHQCFDIFGEPFSCCVGPLQWIPQVPNLVYVFWWIEIIRQNNVCYWNVTSCSEVAIITQVDFKFRNSIRHFSCCDYGISQISRPKEQDL